MSPIPKVFHQIWINRESPALPPQFAAYRDGWLTLHPDWDYRLWNLDNLDFTPTRADLLSQARSYAQMADILRYEILLRHGGVYLDTDFECRRSIAPILQGVRHFACSEDGRSISIGILGCEPGSPYMARCLAAMPRRVGLTLPTLETGPGLFTQVLLDQGLAGDFTLFPRAWFYPYGWDEPQRAGEDFPEAYAIHRWAHSWVESESGLWLRLRRRLARMRRP